MLRERVGDESFFQILGKYVIQSGKLLLKQLQNTKSFLLESIVHSRSPCL